jgi:RNA polymerase primary sigma factor
MDRRHDFERNNDCILVEAIIQGERDAWEEFVRRFSDFVYTFCSSIFAESELEAEYLSVFLSLRLDGFAILRAFDGRASLATFLNIQLRDLLARRVLALFKEDPRRAWEAFQRCFKDILDPLKRRSEDLHQDVCVLLIENNYRRILSFDGRGSFSGYIRRVIDRLCLDLRRASEGRRRLPEPVLRLPPLEQEIYRQVHWKGCREKDLADVLRDETGNRYAPARIEQALAGLRNTALRPRDPPVREISLASPDGDDVGREPELIDLTYAPETALLEAEERRSEEHHNALLENALAQLPAEHALYVRLRFFSEPEKSPREIARLMGRAEREIYRIRHQVIARLKTALK